MWAAFGGADHTRVKDITIESNWTRTYAALCASLGFFSKLPWFQRCTAVANVERDLPWNFGFCDRWVIRFLQRAQQCARDSRSSECASDHRKRVGPPGRGLPAKGSRPIGSAAPSRRGGVFLPR